MSFSDTLRSSVGGPISSARQLLHGGTLPSMARAVGVVGGAGILAASYQIAYEEGRTFIQTIRTAFAARRDRNNAVVCALLSADLPLDVLAGLRRARDAFSKAIDMSVDRGIPEDIRKKIGTTLINLMQKSL